MKKALNYHVFVVLLALSVLGTAAQALPVGDAITAVADRLVNTQITADPDPSKVGTWAGEENFTGSIVAGLVNAYQITGNSSYLSAAELGGQHIVDVHSSNLYGDEAYALSLLGEITGDPTYSAPVQNFYNGLDTYGYIRGFKGTDASNAAFYVAEHTVAADKVGAADAGVWRQALVQFLARVDDDTAFYPVQSMGIATWALAKTGDMDSQRVDPFGLVGEDVWQDVVLSDLPTMLAAHQNAGSGSTEDMFFHRFDHTAAGPGYKDSGYVEDQAFGLLGLIAANETIPGFNVDGNIRAGRIAMAAGVGSDGIVYEHMIDGGIHTAVFAGEWLQAIPEPTTMALLGIGGVLISRRRKNA